MTDAEEQLVCIVLRQRVIIAFSKNQSRGALEMSKRASGCCEAAVLQLSGQLLQLF